MAYLFALAGVDNLRVTTTPITAAPLTMACWARSSNTDVAQTCFSIGDIATTVDFWDIVFAGNIAGDPVRFRAVDTTAGSADGGIGYSANTWHHVCGVEVSATSRFCYVDGSVGAEDTTNRSPDSVDNVTIGAAANSSLSTPFGGDIAECAIWNVALTAAEVAILAKGAAAYMVRPASLVFYAPLISSPIEIRDSRTLTVDGATVSAHPRVMYPPRPQFMYYTPAAPPATAVKDLIGAGMIPFAR